MRRDAQARRGGGHTLALLLALVAGPVRAVPAQEILRLAAGRFTVQAAASDLRLARTVLDSAQAHDSFPGLPRPRDAVSVAIAPDRRRFREWSGRDAPEWGAAIAVPGERRIVMQGSWAGSDAGDPVPVLRHELAHLALHEAMGDLPPRWFDEGYASYCAREWARDEVLAASVGLVFGGVPRLDALDDGFRGGAVRAGTAYALSYRAVADLAALDTARGLAVFLTRWRATGSMDRAMRDAYGLTLDGFEREWRRSTMRRYGTLAVFANLTALFSLIGIALVPLYVSRRRRDRRRLEAMRASEDAAERAARASALAQLLAAVERGGGARESDLPPGGASS